MFLFIALSCSLSFPISLLCYGFHSSLFLYFIIVKILKLLMRLRRWISLLPFEKYAVLNPAVTLSALIEIAETISWDIPRRYLDICQDDILRYANTISWDMPQRYLEICKDDILRYAKTDSCTSIPVYCSPPPKLSAQKVWVTDSCSSEVKVKK